MSLGVLVFVIASVTLSSVAQIAFKYGVSSDAGQGASALVWLIAKRATPGVVVGLALYSVGTLLWLTVLGQVDISQAYPFVGIGFALTILSGWWLFGDQLSALRLIPSSVIFDSCCRPAIPAGAWL